jgi:hypothetical protein
MAELVFMWLDLCESLTQFTIEPAPAEIGKPNSRRDFRPRLNNLAFLQAPAPRKTGNLCYIDGTRPHACKVYTPAWNPPRNQSQSGGSGSSKARRHGRSSRTPSDRRKRHTARSRQPMLKPVLPCHHAFFAGRVSCSNLPPGRGLSQRRPLTNTARFT